MVGHYRMGVRAEKGGAGGDCRPCPGGDSPEWRAQPLCSGGKTPCPRSLPADASAAAGEEGGTPGRAQETLICRPTKLSQSFFINGATLASDILFSPLKRNPIPVKRNGID